MGLTYIMGDLIGKDETVETVEFLVDSGASYTLLPKDIWQKLEIKPKKKQSFTLADGTHMERNISECYIKILGEEGHTTVILGEEGDEALLGVFTLEQFGLMLNPFSRTVQPMVLRLA